MAHNYATITADTIKLCASSATALKMLGQNGIVQKFLPWAAGARVRREINVDSGLRVSHLAKVLAIHQSTASNLLDKLEEKGLVRRERGGPDQRVVRLYATAKGRDLVAHAPRPAQGVLMDALGRLSPGTLAALAEGLGALLCEMRAKDQDSAMEPLSDP